MWADPKERNVRNEIMAALKDAYLREALQRFSEAYGPAREKAFLGVEFEGLRDELARAKGMALEGLEELFLKFKKGAEKAGAKVYEARDAIHANEIIGGIAGSGKVKNIVKSKSMTSEEISLTAFLEERGYKVTETDLGEWIIQLRKERPSHMVLPAIHLSRREVAALFEVLEQRELDPDDVEGLVNVARKRLRPAFLEADMGITGANFALADHGAIGLVTNEGNARLVTTLPRIHVVLLGYEKLVPDIRAALKILMALPRSATGQDISTYVTWIKGRVECQKGKGGRKELHIVFLDNGRKGLLRDPLFAQALRCIRCGACANVCPIYALLGGHVYGHIYIGAIGLVLTTFYHKDMDPTLLLKNCLNCQACKDVCPVKIDLPFLIKAALGYTMSKTGKFPLGNRIMRAVMKDRTTFHFLLKRTAEIQRGLSKTGMIPRHLPLLFQEAHPPWRIPLLSKRPLRERWNSLRQVGGNKVMAVAVFGGCLVEFVYPEMVEAMFPFFHRFGIHASYPQGQTCCGLPALISGEQGLARKIAIQNIMAFKAHEYDWVICPCASCGSHIKGNYPKLLSIEPGIQDDLREFTSRVVDFSSFLVNIAGVEEKDFQKSDQEVTFHASCHMLRGLRAAHFSRELIRIAGFCYLPSELEEACCGFGGTYSINFPEVSRELLRKKMGAILKTGADILVTDCPGCVMQLRGGVEEVGKGIQVLHTSQLIQKALRDR